ncbi:hypothetical protein CAUPRSCDRAFT_10903 [Caulochytrium protostelioides]|uniref:Uncharacterized protein n=1 Tax=Caulochytrium protostelioides TaxID=1555241 RepID=A0A4P9WY22_9FUNG|nr:hypothetical protein CAUPRSCDRAFT_10903 [Caulochytrium protostelioides]
MFAEMLRSEAARRCSPQRVTHGGSRVTAPGMPHAASSKPRPCIVQSAGPRRHGHPEMASRRPDWTSRGRRRRRRRSRATGMNRPSLRGPLHGPIRSPSETAPRGGADPAATIATTATITRRLHNADWATTSTTLT